MRTWLKSIWGFLVVWIVTTYIPIKATGELGLWWVGSVITAVLYFPTWAEFIAAKLKARKS
ncbi:Uncharacterised protein [Corynebacterium renale]|uniref:Uncharacterized protein n=1 Tax=Corynebacterium renale TaxID=1724 RepID=A0A2A9DM69_9CORY|nr:hypothetical protein [Corynebacterium renale]PFG27693.1 hypothetical protein ATK06_0769 [Corynebacterium renale]SQG63597.1 Uncharacterised protein [Corynebacterium renale]SQI22299.1 Uncharacterised protein [Corynebacterium renale]STD01117.1 Uncharacterised protein [Corynebacterium renale]